VTGIREMFAEYSGEDVDWFQMAFWFENARRAIREAQHTYGRFYAKTPRGKVCASARKARWTAKDPAHARAIRLAAQKRWREKNIERIRAEDRARKRRAA
jgi:hypothetical protein